MLKERRNGTIPIPEQFDECINVDQLTMLHTVESFGWTLKYIRDAESNDPKVIVISPDGNSLALLEKDGALNKSCNIQVREQTTEIC